MGAERPRDRRAAEQGDKLAPLQLIKLHSIPASQRRIAGYRMGRDQSAGIGALANAREMKGQQTGARSCTADKESARWRSRDRFALIDAAAS